MCLKQRWGIKGCTFLQKHLLNISDTNVGIWYLQNKMLADKPCLLKWHMFLSWKTLLDGKRVQLCAVQGVQLQPSFQGKQICIFIRVFSAPMKSWTRSDLQHTPGWFCFWYHSIKQYTISFRSWIWEKVWNYQFNTGGWSCNVIVYFVCCCCYC